jgi:hypothetical protein
VTYHDAGADRLNKPSTSIAQVDVEKDTNRVSEIAVVCESLRGRKRQGGVAELPQQSSYTPQNCGVVIDDIDKLLIWQVRYPTSHALCRGWKLN